MEDLLATYTVERETQVILRLLHRQVQDKCLTVAVAAEYANMTPEAFGEAMQSYIASQKR